MNTWDSVNRLRTCVAGQTSSQFAYGPDGLRKQSTVNGAVTRYILDSSMVFRETNGQNAPQVPYLIGPRGPEYRRTGLGQNAQVTWYCYDGLGSVLAEASSTGYITGARQMDVYGAPRATQGSPTSKHAYVGGLGHPTEDDTGLIYMRARWMDPVTGTFVSEDPAKQTANWYSYCGANPVNQIDGDGRIAIFVAAALLAFIVGSVTAYLSGQPLWKCVLVGLLAAGAAFAGFYGPLIGLAGGALAGAGSAWIGGGSREDILLGALFGGAMGALGGCMEGFCGVPGSPFAHTLNQLSTLELCAYFLLSFDMGMVQGDASILAGAF